MVNLDFMIRQFTAVEVPPFGLWALSFTLSLSQTGSTSVYMGNHVPYG